MTPNFRKSQMMFHILGSLFAIVAILILAKGFLIPLAFAMLLSFILYPVVKTMEQWGVHRMIAAFASILFVIILIGSAIFLFTTQMISLSNDFPDFQVKFSQLLTNTTLFINENLDVVPDLKRNELLERINAVIVSSSGRWFTTTFSGTVSFSASLILTLVYLYLILIYRTGLANAFTRFFPVSQRERAMDVFRSLQKVGQDYLFGIVMVIFIVGCLNSVGLWIIGIKHAILFGFIAATLTIIPYIGTLVGAGLPIIYAFVTYDSAGMALTIAGFFWAVQLIEANFITPKIVGGNLQINALTAIMSIVIGATVWGIPGMILFLPLAAMLKVVSSEIEPLKPLGELMSLRD